MTRRPRRLWVLTDYDGTLAPIAPTPAQARLPATTRRVLKRLVHLPRVQVAVISGRSLHDLKQCVGVPGMCYVGNHGLEASGPGVSFVHPEARRFQPALRRLAQRVQQVLRSIPGAWVEWKGLTFSAHCREVAPAARRRFYRVLTELLAHSHTRGVTSLTRGKCVVEVRPPLRWDKGQVVRRLLRHYRSASSVLYLGDDRTDEDAFRVVNRLGGLSVFVGPPGHATAARWRVANPRAVATLLTRILEAYG